MKLTPNKNYLYLIFFYKFIYALFFSILPTLIFIFILGLLYKLGRETTIQDNILLLLVYIVSFFITCIYSVIQNVFYIKKTYILLEKNGIEIFASFINQAKHTIPLINLQSFEVNQTFFEKLLGLGTIYVYSKNEEEYYELPGFDYNAANDFIEKAVKDYGLKIN